MELVTFIDIEIVLHYGGQLMSLISSIVNLLRYGGAGSNLLLAFPSLNSSLYQSQ